MSRLYSFTKSAPLSQNKYMRVISANTWNIDNCSRSLMNQEVKGMKAPEPPLLQVKSDCFCIYVLTGIFLKLVISISLIQPARAKKFDDEEIFWCQHPCLSEYPNSDCIQFAVITVQSFFFFSAQSLTSQVVSFSKTYMGSFCNSSLSTKQPKIR